MQCGSRAPTRPEPSIGHIVDDIKALISSFDFEVSILIECGYS